MARRVLWGGLGLAVGLRVLFVGTYPIYEDDYQRYLWDGAVVAKGLNPYAHAPAEVSTPPMPGDPPNLAALREIAENERMGGGVVERINNPELSTLYPPTAQAAFALAAQVARFDSDGLRWVFLLVEVAGFGVMAAALRRYGRSATWGLLYMLCPLVIFAGMNTLHMDVLLPPFVMAALLWVGRRPMLAAASLALAVGVKVWPLVLGPVLFRQYRRDPARYVAYGALLGGLSLVVMAPLLVRLGETSGLAAYSAGWVRSSFLFPLMVEGLAGVSAAPDWLARLLVAGTVSAVALWLALVARPAPERLPGALLAVVLVLLWLSPTGFPWYMIWAAMFLPFVPSYGVGLLCVSVSLYYARFWFGEAGRYDIYLEVLVPLQFVPPLIVLALEVGRLQARRLRRG